MSIFCYCGTEIKTGDTYYSKDADVGDDGINYSPACCCPECFCEEYDYYFDTDIMLEKYHGLHAYRCPQCGLEFIPLENGVSPTSWAYLQGYSMRDDDAEVFCCPEHLCKYYGFIDKWEGWEEDD